MCMFISQYTCVLLEVIMLCSLYYTVCDIHSIRTYTTHAYINFSYIMPIQNTLYTYYSRGRYLQAIDMNQDGYFEEALKMRNLLQEFDSGITILGFREHIFTGSVSSVANYMALQELSFVTLG